MKHIHTLLIVISCVAVISSGCGSGGGTTGLDSSQAVGSSSAVQTGSVASTSAGQARETSPIVKATTAPLSPMVVLGYNDLGMHCMNQDFSEFCILPPANTLRAQVINRSGEHPQIVTSGVTVSYSIPGNTHSVDKTNFWQYAARLFGTRPPDNIGLFGYGLTGTMKPTIDRDYAALGIPVTPITDQGVENPFQLATIKVTQSGKQVATTQAVVPVSWEISCNLCHNTPGISVATDILRKHDKKFATNLEGQKPVLCGSCHAQAPLGLAGKPGVDSLSRAMHNSHSSRMAAVQGQLTNSCYACHPGVKTQCFRDIHAAKGMTCTSCHTSMVAVADPNRRPWVDEPKCGDCHKRTGFQFEEPGKLFRDSRGHRGVKCESCHGAPHAITPTLDAPDNVQAIALQGTAGTIKKCTVCHSKTPSDPFKHQLRDD